MNEIFKSIQIHLSLLDLAYSSSLKIVEIAKLDDIGLLENEVDNRERLMNAMSQIQTLIENEINKLEGHQVNQEQLLILKTWFNDLSIFTDKILLTDEATVEILTQQKDNTTAEIAHLFTNKEFFKGYNHNLKK